ncbi:MAG: hypothetical protein JNL60_07120, partial [Bacteroidia bacterium]|nr:hypothetical protein [Bacteroidia bacterium]
MFRIFNCLVLLLLICSTAFAQEQSLPGVPENGSTLNVLYRKDQSGKIYATTRGFGAMFRQGKHITANTRSFFEIDLQTLKHPKETKTQGQAEVRRRFVFGKVNQVFLLRFGVGLQNVLFSKADLKAVEVRYSYSIGPTVAFVKPYYYQINKMAGSRQTELVKFNTENYNTDSTFVGRGSYLDGVTEMKF